MEYYEKTLLDHQAVLINTESVNSVIHHFGQLNLTRGGVSPNYRAGSSTGAWSVQL